MVNEIIELVEHKISKELTRRGHFEHLYTKEQLVFRKMLDIETNAGMYATRKIGKTFSLFLMALEMCSKNKNWVIRFVMKEKSQAVEILEDIFKQISPFIHHSRMPQWKISQSVFMFPNNSLIKIGGCDTNHIENLRGGRANRIILDEIASYPIEVYEYLLESLLRPQFTTTGGFFISATTPPESPEHPYITRDMKVLEEAGRLLVLTIDDNTLITDTIRKNIEAEYIGGRDNPNFRREYLAELVANTDVRLCPNFDGGNIKDYDTRDSIDDLIIFDQGGMNEHFSACIRVNISTGVLQIKRFLVKPALSHSKQVDLVKEVVADTPCKLFGDATATTRREMLDRGCVLQHVQKEGDDIINGKILDEETSIKRVIVHPTMRFAIDNFQKCIWNKTRTKFKPLPQYGHADGLVCVAYALILMRRSQRRSS